MTLSKREEIKAQRTRKKRRQRMMTLLTVVAVIVVLVLIFATPTIINMLKPVGSIVAITPVPRPMENGKAIGDPNAKVVVEIFEDFQCPVCKEYTQLDEAQLVDSTYIANGQVYYVFRQYPFIDTNSITKESQQSANASMCAMEQGRFWDYHDMLFANQGAENSGAFSDKRLQAFAETLGLDMTAFNKCFSADTYKSDIQADLQKGQAANVTGTPSIFINGKLLSAGYVPYSKIQSAIEAALAAGG